MVKNPTVNAGDAGLQVQSLRWKDYLKKEKQPTPVFLPEKSMDRGAWWATVHGVTNSQTRQQPNNDSNIVIPFSFANFTLIFIKQLNLLIF